MKDVRMIIAGSRGFDNYDLLKQKSDEVLSRFNLADCKVTIVSGTANGADKLGERYARDRNYFLKRMPAKWDVHGRSAGYIRNAEMAVYAKEEIGILCAFWDGKSRGTKHMIDLANKHGLEVFVFGGESDG